jgi:hypothetical protein
MPAGGVVLTCAAMPGRLVAAVIAVGLVILAVVIRDRADGDSSGSPPATPSVPLRLACDADLEAACKAAEAGGIAVVTQTSGDTLDALSAQGPPTDKTPTAWLTLAPWPDLATLARQAGQLPAPFATVRPLASSRLALIGPKDRMAALDKLCAGGATWKCIGENSGKAWSRPVGDPLWGVVEAGHPSPANSAVGLDVFANAVLSYFGRATIAASDLDDPRFQTWVSRLEANVPSFGNAQQTPLDIMLTQPGVFDAVGTTKAAITASAGANASKFPVAYPSPMAQADVVLAMAAGTTVPSAALRRITAALTSAGWDAPSAAPAGGLPAPPVMYALRQLWLNGGVR